MAFLWKKIIVYVFESSLYASIEKSSDFLSVLDHPTTHVLTSINWSENWLRLIFNIFIVMTTNKPPSHQGAKYASLQVT